MTPAVSVVVPTRNAARTLGACLASLAAQRAAGGRFAIETLVVDNGSRDATLAIARRAGARTLRSGPERSAQRNAGARAARGDYLLFVDADMVLDPGTLVACLDAAAAGAAAVVVPERSFGRGYWARCRALERDCYRGEPLVEAARFVTRDAFLGIGGYDPELDAFEDWDLHDRLVASGRPVLRADDRAGIAHDEGRLRPALVLAKKRYYARALERYRAKHPGTPRLAPAARLRLFARHGGALLRRPRLAAGLALLKAVEAIAWSAPGETAPYDTVLERSA